MDYDDNDFQSQKLQLAGEGSNKFPPTLQPYALPKFDFDDNLHGSLRFDSLVETEVFLGIESNEDSQWIEDFSRGSGGIQFTSSAAESCSIPLRNNVWSEATSSESVEMLLKSVGQEELILAQTRIKESDACDELSCIIKQMEPNLEQNSNITTRVEDLTNIHPEMQPVQFPEKSGSDDDGRRQLSQIEDISHSGGDASGDQGLGVLTIISAEVRSPIAERSPFVDKCDGNGINEMKVDHSLSDSLDNRIPETSASEIQVDDVVAAAQNIIQGNDGMVNKDAPDNVIGTADEVLDISGTETGEHHEREDVTEGAEFHAHVPNAEVIKSGVSHVDNPLFLSPTVNEKSVIRPNLCSVEEPCVTAKDSSIEICHESLIDTHEASLVIIEDGSTDHRREVEDSDGSHLDKEIVIKVVPSPLSIEDNVGSEDKVDGKFSSCEAVNCSSSLCRETNAEDHVPSLTMVENMQMCEKVVSGLHDIAEVDKCVSSEQKTNVVLSSLDSDVGGIDDQSVITSSFGEGNRGELAVSKSEPVSTGGKGSALDTVIKIANSMPCDAANVVSLPLGNGINKDTVCDEVEASPLSTVLTCSDTETETAAKSSIEASLCDLKAAPEVTAGANCVSETEKGSSIAAEQMLVKSDNQLVVVACDAGNKIESHSMVTEKVSDESLKDKVATIPICDSTADTRESVHEQMKGKGNDKKEHVNLSDPTLDVKMPVPVPSIIMESLQDTGLKVQKEVVIASKDIGVKKIAVPSADVEHSADLDNPASGSPTIIRSAPSSYDERNKEGLDIKSNPSGPVPEDKVQSASMHSNKTDHSKDDGSFSFEVNPLVVSPRKNSRKRRASSTVEASRAMLIVDASTSSGLGQLDPMVAPVLPHGSPKVADVAVVLSGSKGNTERKARRASGKAPAKESAKKRNSAKETTSAKLDRGDKMTGVSSSPSGISQPVQSNEIQCFGNLDSNILKPFVPTTSTAGLPDLNSSISQAAVFHQPFTDLQQVQLRAQIFVYGALIQGIVPDEAYMISAFGGSDGGRSMWENSWRSCIERLHGHKSHLSTPETPLQSRSGAIPPEPSIKHSVAQSKAVSTPIGRGSSKGAPAIASPILPFSSPLWTMPTPSGGTLQPSCMPRGPVVDYQWPFSPLLAHQTPGVGNFVGHSPSWLSQAPYGTPWVASQNSTLEKSGRVQFPVTETIQLTPFKETSVHHSSALRPTAPAQISGSTSVFAGSSSMLCANMVTASGSQPSTDPKAKKRKKNSISNNTVQNALPSQPQTESVIASVVASPLSTSVAFTTPAGFVSKGLAEKLVTSSTPMPGDFWKGDHISEHKAILSEETLGKVKDAKVQAEDASASAAFAVSQSQQVWDRLEKQKIAGLLPDADSKVASAAAAIAAAAAVAKAAAAAAKVASNAALQAKLIAEEAVASIDISNINVTSFPDGMQYLGKATPASILKGNGTSSSTSIIGVARETARKKVEAASAAAKRAENMDAIVKAAELAAEAVSQAGKIVAMGDPMPLSDMVAAGPEGYWKVASPELIARSNNTDMDNRNINNGRDNPNSFMRQLKEVPSVKNEHHIASHGKPPASIERFSGDQGRFIECLPGSGVIMMKEPRVQKGYEASDLTIVVVPESENGSRASRGQNEPENEEISKANNMKEGTLVEVYKDGYGFKAAWFPAKVISLKDREAYVEFTELALGEGSEKLKEWVPLEGNGDEAPIIRKARPTTNIISSEGTRKRRRAAMVDCIWSVGDRVDAYIEDSWREGVVTEKNKIDESLLTVNFPARGEILVIPSSLLHPSCIWKNGAWVEWSSSGENSRPSHEGDTPKEKRPRVRSPVAETKGKDKAVESEKSGNPLLLALSTDEKQFNIGKSSKDEHKTGTTRMPRTGLQKEGSRTVFGVPKPGKKRKFMDVSKHYVGNQTNEAKEALKFTKYLMPQGPGSSRPWRSSKPETNEKRAAISKPRVLKSGRSKDNNLSAVTVSAAGNTVNEAENILDKQNSTAFHPSYLATTMSFSARAPQSNKRRPATNAKPEQLNKERVAPPGKLQKVEEGKDNSTSAASDSMEPRRSNRRIQPTSRLLEGLQSSLMVSKIPSILHDKSHKRKNTLRGNNQG